MSQTLLPGYLLRATSYTKNVLLNKTIFINEIMKYVFTENGSNLENNLVPIHLNKQPADVPDFHVNNVDAILYLPTTTSTQDILERIHHTIPETNLLVVCDIQIEGHGRRRHKTWDSPFGCAMFSFNHRLCRHSFLGDRLGFVQHILSLSVVRCFRSEIPSLRIKWPNDVYYKDHKISGVVVNSFFDGNDVHVYLGTGINVDNPSPTDCINRILKEEIGSSKRFTINEVITKVLNSFKETMDNMDEKSFHATKDEYLRCWMHSQQSLVVDGKSYVVKGIDDQGYLLAQCLTSGKLESIGVNFEDISLPVTLEGSY